MWWCDVHQLRMFSQLTVFLGLEPSIRCNKISSFWALIAKLSISFSNFQNNFYFINIRNFSCCNNIFTCPTVGWLDANPTISKQSACLMQRRVQGVKWFSHWYKTMRWWSSCWPNQAHSRYSFTRSSAECPSFLIIKSFVSNKVLSIEFNAWHNFMVKACRGTWEKFN